MALDRIILSANNNPNYLPYWPHVAKAWRSLFGLKPVLSYVTRNRADGVADEAAKHGDVLVYDTVPGIPEGNQAKVARLYTAGLYGQEVCLINDIDLIPLQKKYAQTLADNRPPGHLLCVGADVYAGSEHEGKFPMGYLMGEGYLFREITNPHGVSFEEFVKSFVDVKVYDHKEAINGNTFSDESLLRVLIHRWGKPNLAHANRGWRKYTDLAFDRADWDHHKQKAELATGKYVECHAPHPFDLKQIQVFLDYVEATK